MERVKFLSKVKVKNFTMAHKWVQKIDELNQTVRGIRIEKVPNKYPDDPMTVIGEALMHEGYWMPKPNGQVEFVSTGSCQTVIVAWGMRTRFKATLDDIEPYEGNPDGEELALVEETATTEKLARVFEEKGKLEIWCFTWPDGFRDWVAARSKRQAIKVFRSEKTIGDKDLEEIKVTRQDLRGTNTIKGSIGAGKRWGRVMFDITGPMYIGGKE